MERTASTLLALGGLRQMACGGLYLFGPARAVAIWKLRQTAKELRHRRFGGSGCMPAA